MAKLKMALDNRETYQSYTIHKTGVVDLALKECLVENKPLFMPDLIEARISTDQSFWRGATAVNIPILTTSIIATGTTLGGAQVAVFAHVPNRFAELDNIAMARKKGLFANGAGTMPKQEFLWLVRLAENGEKGVLVVEYDKLIRAAHATYTWAAHMTCIRSGSRWCDRNVPVLHKPVLDWNGMNTYYTTPFIGSEELVKQYTKMKSPNHGIFMSMNGFEHRIKWSESSARLLSLSIEREGDVLSIAPLNTTGNFIGARNKAYDPFWNRKD